MICLVVSPRMRVLKNAIDISEVDAADLVNADTEDAIGTRNEGLN